MRRLAVAQWRKKLPSSSNKAAANKWSVKQVNKSNFSECLDEFQKRVSDSDFVAVSMQYTGSFRSNSHWQSVLSFDTPLTAYCKAKYAAESFQILHLALCPFSIRASNKLVAYPFNFHLFPRDELKMGMPSYSFSCHSSYLTSMARQGFDFNACIYDGISYLSRAQESVAKVRMGNPRLCTPITKGSMPATVADTVFTERVKSRVKYWRDACNNSNRTNEALLGSLRKLILGSEHYGTRPCMNIEVCSERQRQLVLEMLGEFFEDIVPLLIPAKGGGIQAVCVVLTTSKMDKDVLEREILNTEEEENKRVCGFREVIDMISASQKPVVSYNTLDDFTFIHSGFIGPLPLTLDEFSCSLHSVFPHVLDVSQLMRERKLTNMDAALSYLNNNFFAPIDIETPEQATTNETKTHGHNVIKVCHLFAKFCSALKINPSDMLEYDGKHLGLVLEESDDEVKVWTKSRTKVSADHVVILWGFRGEMTAPLLKTLLHGSHDVFNDEFDVRPVDKNCAIVVFQKPGLSEKLLYALSSEEMPESLKEVVASQGLRAGSYETYKRACTHSLWETDLAEALDRASDLLDVKTSQSITHEDLLFPVTS